MINRKLENRLARLENIIKHKNETYDYDTTSDACWDMCDRLDELVLDTQELVKNLQLDGEDKELVGGWKYALNILRQARAKAHDTMEDMMDKHERML